MPGRATTEFHYGSLADVVAQWLAQEVITGSLEPGTRLREGEIAERLGVSRSPVREALRELQSEGLVEISPRRGATVALFDATKAANLYDCRLLIEPECYARAVDALTREQVEELSDVFAGMQKASRLDDEEGYLKLDLEYHYRLAHYCPNRVLVELLDVLWRRSATYRYMVFRLPGRLNVSLPYHTELHAALTARDSDRAAAVTRDLLRDSQESVLATLESVTGPAPAVAHSSIAVPR